MKDRNSTLYCLDNAMTELHFAMMKAIDSESFVDNSQFMLTTTQSIADVRREFENRYGKFKYPSLFVTRSPTLRMQPHNNMNIENLEIIQGDNKYEVRPITLTYTASIVDYRKKYIDEYYEAVILSLHKFAPRVDVQCKVGVDEEGMDIIVHNLTSINYDITSIMVSTIPSYDDKTNNAGQVYVLNIPFTVDTQLIGNYQESKLIHQMVVNYESMINKDGKVDFQEVDQFSTVPKDINLEGNN